MWPPGKFNDYKHCDIWDMFLICHVILQDLMGHGFKGHMAFREGRPHGKLP